MAAFISFNIGKRRKLHPFRDQGIIVNMLCLLLRRRCSRRHGYRELPEVHRLTASCTVGSACVLPVAAGSLMQLTLTFERVLQELVLLQRVLHCSVQPSSLPLTVCQVSPERHDARAVRLSRRSRVRRAWRVILTSILMVTVVALFSNGDANNAAL